MKTHLMLISNLRLRNKFIELYLDNKDKFLSMPASTKYHHYWAGGLGDHTNEVMDFAIFLYKKNEYLMQTFNIYRDDIIISAFIHDLDKLDKYEWDKESKQFKYTSLTTTSAIGRTMNVLARYGITLTSQQLNALTFVEGGWSAESRTNPYARLSQLAVLIHMADMYSTYFLGKRDEKEITK